MGLPKIAIIVTKANATFHLRKVAAKSGRNDFVVKPLDRLALSRPILHHVYYNKTIVTTSKQIFRKRFTTYIKNNMIWTIKNLLFDEPI